MSTRTGKNLVTDGLVASFDAANFKSFRGEQTTNRISGTANGYPTISNAWGTYQVFQNGGHDTYNSGAPFTLTISGVSGNEVTSPSHRLLTYDAVAPQSTGGGVTSGTYYFVKKTGTNTFTLHVYDATEDGSKGFDAYGFAAHNSVNTDTRVSINSTSFPTSWWGYAHKPNTQCVKQLITNGFKLEDRMHDCMRIHWFRSDDTTIGGMAYGVLPTITHNLVYTFSFYHRLVSGGGGVYQYTSYCDDVDHGYAAPYTPVSGQFYPVVAWTKASFTFTGSATAGGNFYSYFHGSNGVVSSVDIAEIQLEVMGHATKYTSGTRSGTLASGGGWVDLSLGHSDLAMYGSGAQVLTTLGGATCVQFTATGQYFIGDVNALPLPATSVTVETWIYPQAEVVSGDMATLVVMTGGSGLYHSLNKSSLKLANYWYDHPTNGYHETGAAITRDTWNHLVAVWNFADGKIYQWTNGTKTSATAVGNSAVTSGFVIGMQASDSTRQFSGGIGLVNLYNRALSDAEVTQNFSALRGRFGI